MPAPTPYNRFLSTAYQGATLANLNNQDGNCTGYSIEVSQEFTGSKPTGGFEPVNSKGIFTEAAIKGFFYVKEKTGVLTIRGLKSNRLYSITVIGSTASKKRSIFTTYIIQEKSLALQVVRNHTETAVFENIKPDSNGNIEIKVKNAERISKYGVINALLLQSTTKP